MGSRANHNRGVRLFLVDDHPLFRQGLKDILLLEPDLTVCGEAEEREDALAALVASKPDLVIVDLKLKNSDGLDLVKDIRRLHPKVFTLVLSMYDESLHAERAIRAGACGYVSKQEPATKVVEAIRRILHGEIYWSERAAAQVASRSVCPARCGLVGLPVAQLSERELEVFELIGSGSDTFQIAASLRVGTNTIAAYRARLKEKLNLKDGTELLQHAIRWNMTRTAI